VSADQGPGASYLAPEDIRSYLVRRGRTGVTSRDALERLWPVYGVTVPDLPRTEVLEIGFGMGEATALQAATDPRPVLAVEVHPAGIASLLRRLEAQQLEHVRLVEGDAFDVLTALPERSLDEVRVYFPDPWPKPRHAKRRLVRPRFADLVASRLRPDGLLHLATDIPTYVEHSLEVLAGWTVEQDRRGRPVTGYERRGLTAGRAPVDLVFRPPFPLLPSTP
jgi:tRNA (guanine-N7-)-methyltransferase